MRLAQVLNSGKLTAAILTDNHCRLIEGRSTADLILQSDADSVPLAALAERLAGAPQPMPPLGIPISPREVWACGCTYETSAAFRDAEHGTREGFYAHVYRAENRPEVFFKGTDRVCVGPDEPIGLRADAKFTAPEPEFALVLGGNGRIVGYTLANDVSAWDIERENPLYLPQSKTFTGCCSLGPVLVTPDEIEDPYQLGMTCTITRGGETIFSGSTSTARLNRRFETLIEYLLRSNNVPGASVLLTGTGIIVTEESALHAGDEVIVTVDAIGALRNRCAVV